MINLPNDVKDLTSQWFEELRKSDLGEIDWLDFKIGETDKIGSCITSFLNKETGGVILFGLEKKGDTLKIDTLSNPQKIIDSKLSKYLGHITDPPINEVIMDVVEYEGKKIIAILVKSGAKFPYFFKGIIYLRFGSDSQPILDKRTIMSLISHEMNLSKALRIMKNELKLIREDTILIRNSIELLINDDSSTNSIWGGTNLIPKKIDDSRIRDIFIVLEPFLSQKSLSSSYYDMLRKIGFINMKIDLLIFNFGHGGYRSYCNFGTLPRDLLQLIDGFEKNI